MKTDKPVSTSRPTDGHGGTQETETPATIRRRYHAGYGDTGNRENEVPDAGGPVLLQQRDRKR